MATFQKYYLISKTVLPDGTVKIDIGDQVLTLTPRENRMLAALQAGVVMQTAAINVGHQSALMAGDMNGRLNRLERILGRLAGTGLGQAKQRVHDSYFQSIVLAKR